MIAFAKFQADIIIHEERADSDNKYEYNLNINITVGIFKDRFIRAIIQKNPLIQALMLKNIISDISKYCIPKKPNWHIPRNPNHSKPHKSITRKSAL